MNLSGQRVRKMFGSLLLIVVGLGAWFFGAVLADTALLRGSQSAQDFFINLLATMEWSGQVILLIIGGSLVLLSLIELLAWPGGWLWRRAAGLGRAALAALWGAALLVESGLIAWGFVLWATGFYLALFGDAPAWGLLAIALLVGPLIALAPELSWRRAARLLSL